jgi:hypothetical protein
VKISIHKAALAAAIALTTAVAVVPAHATLSGSEPRPNFSSQGAYAYAAMAVLGF